MLRIGLRVRANRFRSLSNDRHTAGCGVRVGRCGGSAEREMGGGATQERGASGGVGVVPARANWLVYPKRHLTVQGGGAVWSWMSVAMQSLRLKGPCRATASHTA